MPPAFAYAVLLPGMPFPRLHLANAYSSLKGQAGLYHLFWKLPCPLSLSLLRPTLSWAPDCSIAPFVYILCHTTLCFVFYLASQMLSMESSWIHLYEAWETHSNQSVARAAQSRAMQWVPNQSTELGSSDSRHWGLMESPLAQNPKPWYSQALPVFSLLALLSVPMLLSITRKSCNCHV